MTLHTIRYIANYKKLFLLLSLILIGCAEEMPTSQSTSTSVSPVTWQAPQSELAQRNFVLLKAQWIAATNTLTMSGTSNNIGERILIKNADNGENIASTIAQTNLNWSLELQSLSKIPCRVVAVSESGSLFTEVINSPTNCDANLNNGASLDQTLNAIIRSPETDLSITVNQSVNFTGDVNNIIGAPRFNWNFNGVAQGSSIQNPGNIRFPKAGVYHITLEVSDASGIADPTPAMRMITVTDPLSVLTAQPIVNIDTPMGAQTIMLGDTLNFSGSGSDPASNETVNYMWNFVGIAPNSAMQNPGDIVFTTPGVFNIMLSVSDAVGNLATAHVSITVINPNGNQAPSGTISSPAGDIIINPGDSIVVEGNATDPDGNDPVTYLWEFDGVVADSTMQNPGSINYPDPGVYSIRLIATDSLGLSDMNPPVRVITVQAASPISNDLPSGEIVMPAMDTTIMLGESLQFTAAGTATPGKEPLMFLWSFDGVAADSAAMDAGLIMFPDPGVFTVTLLVIDATNQMDPTPAIRVITVQDPNAGGTPPPMPPVDMVGHIVTPEVDVNILPGDAVNFTGTVMPELNPPYTFLWLFDGAASNSSMLAPGDVIFPNPGIYSVMFFAIDKDGVFDTRPAIRTITAADATTPPPDLAPIVNISNPVGDMTISVGDTITFLGNAIDVSGNNTLNYLWTFGGAAIDDTMLNPAPVTFMMPGVYEVVLTAFDTSTMLGNSQPASVLITVNDSPMPPMFEAPVVAIISPDQDTMINLGDVITFEGSVLDTSGNGMLVYEWSFDDAAPIMNSISPGPVQFDFPGQFDITFTVIDMFDPSGMTRASASISVTVASPIGAPPLSPPTANLPDGVIVEPADSQTISAGDTIMFVGDAINPFNNGQINYEWDFDDGTGSTAQTPGSVTFNQVGVYTVTLTVSHGAVHIDPSPAEVVITVVANAAANN